MPPKPKRKSSSSSSHRLSSQVPKTEVIINIYDLLPPSCLSTALWPLGLSLLHTGVVLNDREYSYGALTYPTSPSKTGVFWNRPRLEPPGGTFRISILQGITYLSHPEIEAVVKSVSARFPAAQYNLLSNNCNHFTNHLVRTLTHREAPAWLNRASKLGKMMPCLVPSAWLDAMDEDNEGIVEEEEEESGDESTGMLSSRLSQQRGPGSHEMERRLRDSDGHTLPPSEYARRGSLV